MATFRHCLFEKVVQISELLPELFLRQQVYSVVAVVATNTSFSSSSITVTTAIYS